MAHVYRYNLERLFQNHLQERQVKLYKLLLFFKVYISKQEFFSVITLTQFLYGFLTQKLPSLQIGTSPSGVRKAGDEEIAHPSSEFTRLGPIIYTLLILMIQTLLSGIRARQVLIRIRHDLGSVCVPSDTSLSASLRYGHRFNLFDIFDLLLCIRYVAV